MACLRIAGIGDKQNLWRYAGQNRYLNYRKGGQQQFMTVQTMEFIRRFARHILPRGFVRIRHYGILNATSKDLALPAIRSQLPEKLQQQPLRQLQEYNLLLCPCCGKETKVMLQVLPKRGPPNSLRMPNGLSTRKEYGLSETGS
jgi:hypothetical protein